jgi:hypothetical protein
MNKATSTAAKAAMQHMQMAPITKMAAIATEFWPHSVSFFFIHGEPPLCLLALVSRSGWIKLFYTRNRLYARLPGVYLVNQAQV